MRGHIQIIQITFYPTILWKCLAKISDQFLDRSTEGGRVFTLISLEHPHGLVYFHDFFDELIDLLFYDVVIKTCCFQTRRFNFGRVLVRRFFYQIILDVSGVGKSVATCPDGDPTLNSLRGSFRTCLQRLMIWHFLCETLDYEGAEELHNFHLDPIIIWLQLYRRKARKRLIIRLRLLL